MYCRLTVDDDIQTWPSDCKVLIRTRIYMYLPLSNIVNNGYSDYIFQELSIILIIIYGNIRIRVTDDWIPCIFGCTSVECVYDQKWAGPYSLLK